MMYPATALGLLTALAALVLAGPASAVAACPPIALVDGDPAAAAKVRRVLAAAGVATWPQAPCPAVSVWVEPSNGRLRVSRRTTDGREIVRTVSTAVVAATVIESWARSDLFQRFVQGPKAKAGLVPARVEATASRSRPSSGVPAAQVVALVLPWGVGSLISLGRGGDGSSWLDVTLDGRARVGPTSVGVAVRGAADPGNTGGSSLVETSRLGLDVLATAAVPMRVGGGTFSPSIGLGAGWMRSSYAGPGVTGDAIDTDSAGFRLQASLGFEVPITGEFSVAVGVILDLRPLARPATIDDSGVMLAGEPSWLIRTGIGLRYGVR